MGTEAPWIGQLPAAVATAKSWRGVMRELSLDPFNGGLTRTIRRRAALLGLDTSHFSSNRSWSDSALRQAITQSRSWDEVMAQLGLTPQVGGSRTLVKAHAIRLGLDFGHLGRISPPTADQRAFAPDLVHLRRAAESLATTWFMLCGCGVARPVEPDTYDLLVDAPDGIKRVQVKTTTRRTQDGFMAQIGRRPYSAGNNGPRVPYDPDLIDLFFIVDGDLSIYLIPSLVLGGRTNILLRAYTAYIVGNASRLTEQRAA